jgi:hypothetical protein
MSSTTKQNMRTSELDITVRNFPTPHRILSPQVDSDDGARSGSRFVSITVRIVKGINVKMLIAKWTGQHISRDCPGPETTVVRSCCPRALTADAIQDDRLHATRITTNLVTARAVVARLPVMTENPSYTAAEKAINVPLYTHA